MLNFLGIGNSFSTKHLNTSAYFIENHIFYLIDCGENVFGEINKLRPYKECNKVIVLLTHFHSDHIGSLGTFVFSLSNYGFSKNNIILFNPNKKKLKQVVALFGLFEDCIITNDLNLLKKQFKCIKQKHYNDNSYGYLFKQKDELIYFSGDTSEIPDKIVDLFNAGEISKLYIDTTLQDSWGYHLPISKLKTVLNMRYADRVYCMHLPDELTYEEIKAYGFNVANSINRNKENENARN